MAKKEDLKSLKKEVNSLKEKRKKNEPEMNLNLNLVEKLEKMELFQEKLENQMSDFEAKILSKIKNMGENESDLDAVRSLIDQMTLNIKQESGQTIKKLREKVPVVTRAA